MPYIELVGAPGCGKTTRSKEILLENPDFLPGRRSLCNTDSPRTEVKAILQDAFPAAISLLIFGIADLWRAICFFYTLSASAKIRLRRSVTFFILLVRSRFFNVSKHTWIIDQGLLQHIQTCLALGIISENTAKNWVYLCRTNPSYAPLKIEFLAIELSLLLERIQKSPKHIDQLTGLTVENYANSHIAAFNALYFNEKPEEIK